MVYDKCFLILYVHPVEFFFFTSFAFMIIETLLKLSLDSYPVSATQGTVIGFDPKASLIPHFASKEQAKLLYHWSCPHGKVCYSVLWVLRLDRGL